MPVTAQTLRDSSEQLIILVNNKDYEVILWIKDDAVGQSVLLLRDVVNKSSDR